MPHWPPDLAEHMAEYFSRDARHWPFAQGDRPLLISLAFGDATGWYVAPLTQAWNALLAGGYRVEGGSTIASAMAGEGADAVLRFREERHPETNDRGLAYELSFASSSDAWPGWFSLEA